MDRRSFVTGAMALGLVAVAPQKALAEGEKNMHKLDGTCFHLVGGAICSRSKDQKAELAPLDGPLEGKLVCNDNGGQSLVVTVPVMIKRADGKMHVRPVHYYISLESSETPQEALDKLDSSVGETFESMYPGETRRNNGRTTS